MDRIEFLKSVHDQRMSTMYKHEFIENVFNFMTDDCLSDSGILDIRKIKIVKDIIGEEGFKRYLYFLEKYKGIVFEELTDDSYHYTIKQSEDKFNG